MAAHFTALRDDVARSGAQGHALRGKHIVVLGTPEHEGRIAGRAFELLEVTPTYVLDGLPHALDALPAPDVMLVTREWSRGLRVAVARARRRGIPVVYQMDGVIEWSYVWNNQSFVSPEGTVLQPLLASHVCTVGRHQAQILAGLGLADRVHVVGLPRLDDLDRQRVVDPSKPPTVLVTTARTWAHNVEHKTAVRRAIRDLKAWFDAHPFVRPVWRVAPEIGAALNLPLDTSASVIDTLRHAQALISFTSTTLLEGMAMGVPSIQVDYRPVPQYVQTAWEIRSPEHLDSVLQSALHPAPERLAHQDWCLDGELEAGDASARLADVIRLAIADGRSPRALPPQDRVSHGRLDYRQVHSQLSAFAVSPMSVLQYELDATASLLDFSMPELVRLRDEVARLNVRAQSLEGELGVSCANAEAVRAELSASAAAHASTADDASAREAVHRDFIQRVYVNRLQPVVKTMRRARVRALTIYGAGDVGRAMIAACRANGITIARVVDANSALWGHVIDGIPVMPLDACAADRSPAIVLASFVHGAAMRKNLRSVLGRKKARIFAPARWVI